MSNPEFAAPLKINTVVPVLKKFPQGVLKISQRLGGWTDLQHRATISAENLVVRS